MENKLHTPIKPENYSLYYFMISVRSTEVQTIDFGCNQ